MAYAELIARSNYSFLDGASHPEELVAQAKKLGHSALALGDYVSLSGVVKAHLEAKKQGLHLVVAAELDFDDAPPLVLLAQDLQGYQNLSELVSMARLSSPKGESFLQVESLEGRTQGLVALDLDSRLPDELHHYAELFGPENFYMALWNHMGPYCHRRFAFRAELSEAAGILPVVTNPSVFHHPDRQRLQDVLTCIRHGTTISQAGTLLFPNAERHLKSEKEMLRLFPQNPEWVHRSAEIAARCHFSLDELRYQFPSELLPPGESPDSWLRQLTWQGLAKRYPQGIPEAVRLQSNKELGLIEEMNFAGYFLTVWDIVRFARQRQILCQGRGSAANSVVCYALEITSIDPVRMDLLFERFISHARSEPPDIDVDFEHERREEVLQYIYSKYGRERAAMVAAVITYRSKLAIRDVGKVMELSADQIDRLARSSGGLGEGIDPAALRGLGLDPRDFGVRTTLELAAELKGFPRHLSIHSGGFVITHQKLSRLVPLENAAMEGRTIIQWDKDDSAAVGLLKIDLLSLGMLSLIARAFEQIQKHCARHYTLASIPAEDPEVYRMLSEADSVGVFQVESRAQMNMLPRLRPRCFYDLVVQVAIIRPGPIQGGMIHPYLRRRSGQEPVSYPHPSLRPILEKTLGVPLFQEQGMKLAVTAAGFSPAEADELRRAMNHKRSKEQLDGLRERLLSGMAKRGITDKEAEEVFQQLMGFSGYGFPESHSASFALLVYASSYLKRHYPAIFAASLLNAQPMGFYAPHTIVEDARRHGVAIRPIDVFYSEAECSLEEAEPGEGLRAEDLRTHPHWVHRSRKEGVLALRLGLKQIRGLRRDHITQILEARNEVPFRSLADFAHRARLPRPALAHLAAAGALAGFGLERREALWRIQALAEAGTLFAEHELEEEELRFDEGDAMSRVAQDYATTGLSLHRHPMALVRPQLSRHVLSSAALAKTSRGRQVQVAGMVVIRQRPSTANGMVFLTLEDELGFSNVAIVPDVWERYRSVVAGSLFICVRGKVERSGQVVSLKAQSLEAVEMREGAAEASTEKRSETPSPKAPHSAKEASAQLRFSARNFR